MKVRHKIFDTAASYAGVDPWKAQAQLLATSALLWLKRKAEGGKGSQTGQVWNFSVFPSQFEARRAMREQD